MNRASVFCLAVASLAPFALAACSGTKATPDSSADSGSDTGTGPDAVCTQPTPIACTDQIISDLSLHDDKTSTGDVVTTTDGTDFLTTVDASAGGFGNETKHAWTYLKFTPTGAEKVSIDDETALTSMDWDLSARRFILRLNGGSSGPSCVGADAVGGGATYESITSIPSDAAYAMDAFYDADCNLIGDSSGLPGSPAVALAAWWSYASCLETTGQPFLIQLADGHVIKLRVESYYGSSQDECNSTGTTSADGGYFIFRWAYLN